MKKATPKKVKRKSPKSLRDDAKAAKAFGGLKKTSTPGAHRIAVLGDSYSDLGTLIAAIPT